MMSSQFSMQRRHLFYDEPRPLNNGQLQIVKLFDAFFLGNSHAGQELQFLNNNKITLVINVAPQEVHLHPVKHISLLTHDFYGKKGDTIAKLNILAVLDIIAKIQYCLHSKSEGVAIVAKNIQSRVLTFTIIYLMIKYRWNFTNAFSFIQRKYPGAQVSLNQIEMLQKFSSNRERNKLSDAFQTQSTAEEEQLLCNTIKNSQTINMPNFHGLTFQKANNFFTSSSSPLPKKVKFCKHLQEIIGQKEDNRKDSITESPIHAQKNIRISNAEKRLREYIKQKCYPKQNLDISSFKQAKSEKGDELILIKSKDIICRVPRKRAVSKTEQSSRNLKQKDFKIRNNQLTFQFKQQDSLFKQSQKLKVIIPSFEMEIKMAEKLTTKSDESDLQIQKNNPKYSLHNNKRYRVSRKVHTEESMTSYPQKVQISPEKKKQAAPFNHIFKISKSNKTSYKKIKANSSMLKPPLGKDSEKLITIMNNQYDYTKREQGNSLRQQSSKHQRIINVNFNLQIDNINLLRQDERENYGASKSKNFTKVFHSKTISK